MGKPTTWAITMSGDRPIEEVAAALAKAGLVGPVIHAELGIISGTCQKDVAEELRRVPGVVDVSEDLAFDVGPPGSSDTW